MDNLRWGGGSVFTAIGALLLFAIISGVAKESLPEEGRVLWVIVGSLFFLLGLAVLIGLVSPPNISNARM